MEKALVTHESIDAALREKLDKLIESHSLYIDLDIVVDLYTGFENLLRFAGPVLYNVAKKAGKLMAERLIKAGILNQGNMWPILLYSFVRARYATRAELVEEKEEKGKKIYRVKLEGTLLGSRLKRKKPVDQVIAGYIAGWLETLTGRRVDAKEVMCQAKGDPYCLIEVTVK